MTNDNDDEGCVVLPEQWEELEQMADDGDELSRFAVVGIEAWLQYSPEEDRCMECDVEFGEEEKPGAFAVGVNRHQNAVAVSGICCECVTHAGRDERQLLKIAKRNWRSMWSRPERSRVMTNRQLQMRLLTAAYDRGADRNVVAAAFRMADAGDISLTVLKSAGRLSLRVTPTSKTDRALGLLNAALGF